MTKRNKIIIDQLDRQVIIQYYLKPEAWSRKPPQVTRYEIWQACHIIKRELIELFYVNKILDFINKVLNR